MALAGAPATWRGAIDGVPTWVTVVPNGHEITAEQQASSPWWRWGNTTTDSYLFAFNSETTVYLVLRFSKNAQGLPEARLYDDDQGATPVRFEIAADGVHVLSTGGNPRLTVVSRDGHWLVGNRPDYNLLLYQDGFVESYRLANVDPSETVPDGRPELKILVGMDGSGRPSWETVLRVFDPHPTWGGLRFNATELMPGAPAFAVESPIMPPFPFLGISSAPIDWFVRNPSPIRYDLSKRKLQILDFVGFQTGGIYSITSPDYPPNVSFESPFMFYNFDPSTRDAQIVLRAESWPAGSTSGPGPTNANRTAIRYSWETAENGMWRYGLHVAGNVPYPDKFTIGDTKLNGLAMQGASNFVAHTPWSLVTFVEATQGYPGSEGIYFYSAQNPTNLPWLYGSSDKPVDWLAHPYLNPDTRLGGYSGEGLPPGFRGEFNAAYLRQPALYFSPIDNRLHLKGASGGVFNLGDGTVLREQNLEGGDTIDAWTHELVPAQQAPKGATGAEKAAFVPKAIPGTVEEALYTLDGLMVYGSPNDVVIRKLADPVRNLDFVPPTDKASWDAFSARITPLAATARDPRDLRSWLSSMAGTETDVVGASLTQVRVTASGLRAVLDLRPGFSTNNALGLPLPANAGRYVLSYDRAAGTWRTVPATQPDLAVRFASGSPRQYLPSLLQVTISNAGTVDWSGNVSLQLAGAPVSSWGDVVVDGQGTRTLQFQWSPQAHGTVPAAVTIGGRVIGLPDVHVARTSRLSLPASLALTMPLSAMLGLAGLLLAVVLLRKAAARASGEDEA